MSVLNKLLQFTKKVNLCSLEELLEKQQTEMNIGLFDGI